ncbi:hypothetical protein LWS69_15355 [Bordetella hinzii]|nr:hypothetical protein [Bordetella hinzii]
MTARIPAMIPVTMTIMATIITAMTMTTAAMRGWPPPGRAGDPAPRGGGGGGGRPRPCRYGILQ